ncbi:hypothetical protein [Micromonospora aurantiaca (nom. illeg.)]|uniref:hypothetical protein n=1 Tax=Micromonospora aurantiaca (nom. illeg.) TaxID=47850 RepID=UPI0037AF0D8D
MLSFTAVHRLTGCLIAADADADLLGWGQPATLLLIHDRPTSAAEPTPLPEARSVEFPLRPEDQPSNAAGLPALLRHLTDALHHATPYRATLAAILGRIHASAPRARLLAWAACYPDVHTVDGQQRPVRRVDAVDTDGRLYRLTRPHGEDHPLLTVDDTPHPTDNYWGLAALLAATHAYTPRHPSTPVVPRRDREEPVFSACGPDGIRCQVCGAVNAVTVTDVPSMAGYGEDTSTRCTRCGSAEITDPIFGWRPAPATWPPLPRQPQP